MKTDNITLLSIGNDSKTIKGEKLGYLTGIQYLAPHRISGLGNVCPWATAGCMKACLYTAGRGGMNSIQQARIRRTRLFFEQGGTYREKLREEIRSLCRQAERRNLTPCVRLNGTSDIKWEDQMIVEQFPGVQFYDYTKSFDRMLRSTDQLVSWPKNYHLTFSRSETNDDQCRIVLERGGNVAVVFRELPPTLWGFRVVSGDDSDLRFHDPRGVVIGLTAKGAAKRDTSGFVYENNKEET